MPCPRPGAALCIGMLLLAMVPVAPASAALPQAQGRRSLHGLLPLDIAQIQREADYTKGTTAYFNPTFGLVALGIGVIFGLAWLVGGNPIARLRGDPVPSRIRTRLDRLESARLTVLGAIRAAKAERSDLELAEEKAIYDALATAIDDLLDKARLDLLLNLVDADALVPALDALTERARSLSFRLRRLAPVRSRLDHEKITVSVLDAGFARIGRGWDHLFSSESAKTTTIRQLRAMQWPRWSRIEAPPRRIE